MRGSLIERLASPVDIKDFLSDPSIKPDLASLNDAPTSIDLFEWLLALDFETGLMLRNGVWYVARGIHDEVPGKFRMGDADVEVHTHTALTMSAAIPSLQDFAHSLVPGRNFIASSQGLTEYFPPSTKEGKPIRGNKLVRLFDRPMTRIGYLSFLEEAGARFETTPWNQLDNTKLAELFQVNNK